MIDIDDKSPLLLDSYVVHLRPASDEEPMVVEVRAEDHASARTIAILRSGLEETAFSCVEVFPGRRR